MVDNQILRINDLTKLIGVSRSMIYLYLNQKSKYYDAEFPRPIKLSERAIGWKYEEVAKFINTRTYK